MIITENFSQKFKILVVDDDPAVLDLFQQVLSSAKTNPLAHLETEASEPDDIMHQSSLTYDVVTFRQGNEAVDAVKKSLEESRPFSAAFIDVRMPPGPDGIWTAEQIRRLDKNIEILIMTGYYDEHPRDITNRVPPAHKLLYVQKPIHVQEIYQFASALNMKWFAECELQKLNRNLEQAVAGQIREFKIINKELQAKIVEFQEVQSALRESEAKYRRLFESLVDVFYQADNAGKITMISPSITKAAGYKPEEVIGSYLKDYYKNPDERNKFLELISTNGFVENFEVQMKKKDGSVLWASVNASLSKDQEGNLVGVEGIARDITKRINAEVKLRDAKERFRNLTEITSDWIWEVDKNGRYTYASPKVYDILGYHSEELIGKTPFDLMPSDEADRVSRIFNKIAISKKSFDCLENINLHKDGYTVILETSGIPIFDRDGELLGYRGIDRDVTIKKRAEEALRESESRYRALAENSKVGFWQTTLDGDTLYVNPAMCRMLEVRDAEELYGKSFDFFFDDENLQIIKRELTKRKKGISSTYEVELIGKKGTKRNLMISGAPIFLSENKIHSSIGTFTDITDKKRFEKELLTARNELEKKVSERTIELENTLEKIKEDEKELFQQKRNLEKLNKELIETNYAVSVLAKNIDRKKEELERKVINLFNSKLFPILKKLQKDVHCKKRQADLELIVIYLYEIVNESSFHNDVISLLTDQEMRVAILIKNGLTSQKIADMLFISLHTVKTHRKNIRKKMKLFDTKINLSSYLKSKLMSDPTE